MYNLKKIIIVLVLAVSIVTLIVLFLLPAKETNNIKILTLSKITGATVTEAINSLDKELNISPDDIYIKSLVMTKSKKQTIKVSRPASYLGKGEKIFKQKVIKSIYSIAKGNIIDISKIANPTLETNRRLEFLFTDIIKNSNVDETTYILIGAFNKCYDTNAAKILIKKEKKNLKKFSKNTKIIWSSFDPPQGENYLRNYLSTNVPNIKIIDKTVNISQPRICTNNLKNNTDKTEEFNYQVDIIAFSKYNYKGAKKIINYIKSKLKDYNIKINYISNDENNSITYNVQKEIEKIKKDIINFTLNASQAKIKSSRFIMKRVVNQFSIMRNKIKSTIFLVGKFPVSKRKLVDIKTLKNNSDLDIKIDLTSNKSNINVQQIFLNAFGSLNLQVSKL